jgi:hypothetical protein
MVGLVRFEATEPPKQTAYRRVVYERSNVSDTQIAGSREAASVFVCGLKQKLAAAESERRKLIADAFIAYPGDMEHILRFLISEAALETLS